MIKSIIDKFRLFGNLGQKTFRLFFSWGWGFLLITCLFCAPLIYLDEWLYSDSFYLKSINLYVWLDGLLYVLTFLLFVALGIIFYRSVSRADHEGKIRLLSSFAELPKFFFSSVRVHFFYAVKVILWGLLLIIPGIFTFFLYSFSGPALVLDGKKGKEALLFSRQIIACNLNVYFDMVVIMTIFQMALFMPFYLVINQLHRILYLRSFYVFSNVADLMLYLLAGIHFVIFQIFFYCLYEELKKLKEDEPLTERTQ